MNYFIFLVLVIMSASVFPAHGAIPEKAQLLDRVVAVVNDDVVTQLELEKELGLIKKQILARNQMLPPKDILEQQVLERIILRRLQMQLAERNHIKVDDDAVNKTILQFATENNLTLSQYRAALEREGFSFSDYREGIREEMTISRLRQRHVVNRILVSQQEVEDFLSTQMNQGNANDEYHLAHILVAVPDSASPEQLQDVKNRAEQMLAELRQGKDFSQMAISKSDGQQALDGGDLGWRSLGQVPSLFAGLVARMQPGAISDLIRSPSGFHIIKVLDKRSNSEKNLVTQTQVRHILIRTNEVVSADMAQTRLNQLRQRILDGEDFAELARSHSEDNGSAARGGDLGWINPGNLVPEFEEVMNKSAPGEVSEPFRSPFGWHILQVVERRQHDNTEESRLNQARNALRQRKIEEQTELWLRNLRDEAFVEIK